MSEHRDARLELEEQLIRLRGRRRRDAVVIVAVMLLVIFQAPRMLGTPGMIVLLAIVMLVAFVHGVRGERTQAALRRQIEFRRGREVLLKADSA